MKYLFEILFVLILITISGCENEEILTPQFEYEEYIVVQAEIQANKYFPAMRFTKTLPLGVPYRIEDAELKDVTAYIKRNGVQIIPLVYTSQGLYKPLYDLFVVEGETYELFAMRDETYIYSITRIPYKPEITNVYYNSSEHSLNAAVNAKEGEVYAALWIVTTTPPVTSEDYYAVSSAAPGSNVVVTTSPLPEQYRGGNYSDYRYIQVNSFDQSFEDYFNSRTSGNEINDPFVQGGGEVIWNVQGEKTIGLFIGVSRGTPQLVF
ncbi:MAG: hypothetical protein A2W30_01870 [Ignavibacteria bacterium RBG_16_36_9]|nr:MAG: hypothetical protein A2W30_01870 [Ignavibacteria bacterium RBG_16_36_9]